MALFSLEADLEGAAGVHGDVPTDLHGLQAGLIRCHEGADGGHHPLVQAEVNRYILKYKPKI